MKNSDLDRVGSLFDHVHKLAGKFEKVRKSQVVNPLNWFPYRLSVEKIREDAKSLVEWCHGTNHKEVVACVEAAWKLAQKILDTMKSPCAPLSPPLTLSEAKGFKKLFPNSRLNDAVHRAAPSPGRVAAYSSFFPELNSLRLKGCLAVKAAREAEELAKAVNPFPEEPKAGQDAKSEPAAKTGAPPQGPKSKRGPKPKCGLEADQKFIDGWQGAKAAGILFKDYCSDNKKSVNEGVRILDRARKRKKRSK